MNTDLIKANLNLYAVLVNLEDLVKYDSGCAAAAKDWDVSIQFIVSGGPKAYVQFKNGVCTVGRGKLPGAKIKLFFFSPAHLNKMFDGKASPIPLKGFTRIGFLTNDFTKLTERLAYYLKPTPELLKDKNYMAINTRFTINTAGFALPELAELDDVGQKLMGHMMDGTILLKVLPDGPAVHIVCKHGKIATQKGDIEKPMSAMFFRNLQVASDLLNGKLDGFTAVALGDVLMRGQLPMIDSINGVLDRIPVYLS
jgi:hypothetical protein